MLSFTFIEAVFLEWLIVLGLVLFQDRALFNRGNGNIFNKWSRISTQVYIKVAGLRYYAFFEYSISPMILYWLDSGPHQTQEVAELVDFNFNVIRVNQLRQGVDTLKKLVSTIDFWYSIGFLRESSIQVVLTNRRTSPCTNFLMQRTWIALLILRLLSLLFLEQMQPRILTKRPEIISCFCFLGEKSLQNEMKHKLNH